MADDAPATWWTCPVCNEWSVGEPTPDLKERPCFARLDEGEPCRWEPTPA